MTDMTACLGLETYPLQVIDTAQMGSELVRVKANKQVDVWAGIFRL